MDRLHHFVEINGTRTTTKDSQKGRRSWNKFEGRKIIFKKCFKALLPFSKLGKYQNARSSSMSSIANAVDADKTSLHNDNVKRRAEAEAKEESTAATDDYRNSASRERRLLSTGSRLGSPGWFRKADGTRESDSPMPQGSCRRYLATYFQSRLLKI